MNEFVIFFYGKYATRKRFEVILHFGGAIDFKKKNDTPDLDTCTL